MISRDDFVMCMIAIVGIIILIIMAFMMYQLFIISMDAISTRSLKCENVVVNDTTISLTDGYASLYVVVDTTPRQLLDIAYTDKVSQWNQLRHGDIISAKLGKQTISFCEV